MYASLQASSQPASIMNYNNDDDFQSPTRTEGNAATDDDEAKTSNNKIQIDDDDDAAADKDDLHENKSFKDDEEEHDLIMFNAAQSGGGGSSNEKMKMNKKEKPDRQALPSFLSSCNSSHHFDAVDAAASVVTNHRQLNESQVEYKVFILIDNSLETTTTTASTSNSNSTPSSQASTQQTSATSSGNIVDEHRKQVDKIYEKMIDYCNVLANDYMWNNEKFYLSRPSLVEFYKDKLQSYYACNGLFDYGDNVDDEWFTVYVLLKLTSKFSKILAAQIQDQDGEFMLIHSANYLPAWASSAADNFMHNRVFLYDGKLHMIPPASTPAEITYLPASGAIPNALDAVKIVHDFPKLTCALDSIQKSIQKRLSIFDSIANSTSSSSSSKYSLFHKATCTIPAKLAWVLNNNPSLISSAVNRFCDKDPSDLKLCRLFDCFKPMDFVNYRVKFTKHLYGKLKYCDYKPDKRHEWPSLSKLMAELNASTPTASVPVSNSSTAAGPNANASIIQERSMMGFKLTCAFEIMSKYAMKDVSVLSSRSSPPSATLSLKSLTSFDEYVQRLKSFGYFGNNMEDSKKYNELLDQARKAFELEQTKTTPSTAVKSEPNTSTLPEHQQNTGTSSIESSIASLESSSTSDVTTAKPAASIRRGATNDKYSQLIESLYSEDLKNYNYVNKVKQVINTDQIKEEDDSDDWLCVDAPKLDDYLEMYSRGDAGSAYDFRMITNAFKRFLQSPSKNAAAADKDLLEGVDYKPIDARDADGQLIDFNIEKIESNLADILTMSGTKAGAVEDDENDSFYEIGGDELLDDESLTKDEIEASTKSLKNYMNLMDNELSDQRELSRLNHREQPAATATTGQASSNGNDIDININLVSNALESYSSQCGLTGPVSNIFKSLGL